MEPIYNTLRTSDQAQVTLLMTQTEGKEGRTAMIIIAILIALITAVPIATIATRMFIHCDR